MKTRYYEVTVKKTVVMSQTYLIEAGTKADAVDRALDHANEANASTKDSGWRTVAAKEMR